MAGHRDACGIPDQRASGMSAAWVRAAMATERRATRSSARSSIPNKIKTLRTGQAVVISKLPEARARTVRVAPPREERRGPEMG